MLLEAFIMQFYYFIVASAYFIVHGPYCEIYAFSKVRLAYESKQTAQGFRSILYGSVKALIRYVVDAHARRHVF